MKQRRVWRGLFVFLATYFLFIGVCNAGAGRWALQAWVNATQPALGRSFRCARVAVTPTLRVRLTGVEARWARGRETYTFSLASLQLNSSLLTTWLTRHLALTLIEGRVTGRELAIEGIALHFDGPLPGRASAAAQPVGRLTVRRAALGQLVITQWESSLMQDHARYVVEPLTMRAYGGTLRGRLSAEMGAAPRAALTLTASRLQLGELAPLNAEMFRGATGALDGTLQVAGDRSGVTTLDGALTIAAPGGRLGASFLRALLPYLPKSLERQRLEAAMARGELVAFESASLIVTIVEPSHVKMVLTMAIPEYNLVLDHVTVDVQLESPQLLAQLVQFVQFVGTLH